VLYIATERRADNYSYISYRDRGVRFFFDGDVICAIYLFEPK
jgi:hypothetical protein